MEKIIFSNHIFDKQTLHVKNNICFILGNNSSGKTQILNTLVHGFKGKTKTVKVDEQYVNAGDYQVVFLKEFFDIQNEIKISRTSEFRSEILKCLNKFTIEDDRYELLLKKLAKLSNEIEEIINDNFTNNLFSVANENIKLKTKLELNSLENIIDKLLKINICDVTNESNNIIDDTNYSRFILRMLILNILASYLDVDVQRPTIFLIDLPELYGTPKMLFKVNNFIKQLLVDKNIFLFVVTNSPWYLNSFKPPVESINLINRQAIYKVNNSQKIIKNAVVMHSFLESNDTDFVWYQGNLNRVLEDDDIVKETSFFYDSGFKHLSEALFADEVFLAAKLNEKSALDDFYKLSVYDDVKIQLMVFYFLEAFNVKCQISSDIKKIDKIINLLDRDSNS